MRSINIIVLFSAVLVLSIAGCITPQEACKGLLGISTKALEDGRKDALVKVLNYDCKTCYDKTEAILKAMPKTSIYAKSNSMIAVYYVDPNTDPVGIFFKEVDAGHTQVEVTSPNPASKEWVSKNVLPRRSYRLLRLPGRSKRA